MFRPIKNLINYIQNASGNAIFGSATVVAEAADEAEVVIARANHENIANEKRIIKHKIEMDQDEVQELNGDTCSQASTENVQIAAEIVVNSDYEEEEDIELQIKSSIMLKQPLKGVAVNGNIALMGRLKDSGGDGEGAHTRDYNQNNAIPDELDDFRLDPTQPTLSADAVSVTSEEFLAGEETADDFMTEEEDAEESYLTGSNEVEKFTGSEIIVLADADLNSSIASEAPSEDPLAIDDFTQPSVTGDTPNPLDSSTNDEASTSDDVLWINIDDIKTHSISAPSFETADSGENTPTGIPQHELPQTAGKVAVAGNQSLMADGNQSLMADGPNRSEDHAEELRSDGSDSGLGSETSTLQNTLNSLAETSHLGSGSATATPTQTPTHEKPPVLKTTADSASTTVSVTTATVHLAEPLAVPAQQPLRSNLKRRLEVDDALESPDDIATSTQQKKPKRSINFENVKVYYFPRQQGFGCVPSAGGCTLGMGARHIGFKTLTLAEHAAELRRAHRLQLQEINPRGSSSDDSEESEEDYLSEGSGSDLDAESSGFLQPVSPKQRRALLKAAGVRKIDASEKAECRDIRNSREVCGCTCVDFCDPETCACSQAGIKCQVDRAMFPCGCSRDACSNTVGRVEFNPTRVRTHFIHTIMRLEMENRQQQNPPLCGSVTGGSLMYGSISTSCAVPGAVAGAQSTLPPPAPHSLPTNNYYNLQPQSNYSSGYASPAYSGEQGANYYQHPAPPYQLDSLDAGLYTSAVTATPSYGDILPAYGSVSTATAATPVYHGLNYSSVHSGSPQTGQVSSYGSYHHAAGSSGYLAQQHNTPPLPPPTTYSSCAVPSIPPFGTATTTAASPQYHSHSSGSLALETTAPSCLPIDGGVTNSTATGSSFISLNTPIASSTRISQIKDLLQHNRSTNATLVSVSQCARAIADVSGAVSSADSCISSDNAGVVAEDIEKPIVRSEIVARKSWLEHDVAPAKLPQAEPPPPGTSTDGVDTAVEATDVSVDAATTTAVTDAVNVVSH